MTKLPPAVLPNWHPRTELSRPSAERLSRAENRKQTLTYAGPNAVIPIVYGEQIVGGPVIVGPVVSGSILIWAVALCWAGPGGVERIEAVNLGDASTALAAITNVNDGAIGSVSGVSVRVYDGRQTTHNAQLAALIPGFTDTFAGIAYARISIIASAFTSFPDVTFRVKGRRCFDPRTSTTVWTENPVLHMRDFVTNAEFGMGVGLIGFNAAADIADSLYSGLPRSRSGLCIQDPTTEEDALALFAQYAEVLWSYDGQDVSIIPDAPVDVIHPIPAETIRSGSINMSTVGLEQIPTLVRIQFTDRNSDAMWATRPALAQVPEHALQGMPNSPSDVPMPGVFNRLEAERRAYQRLMRLQAPGRIEWQMFAPGMPYQAGDVVRLPDRRGLQSVDVRITAQPEMIGPLLYQMGGEIYRASDYPAGADGVAVPTGAILILRGSGAVPDGWTLVSIDNRLIREGAPGNAGSAMTLSATFWSNLAGEHSGTRDEATRLLPIIFNDSYSNLAGPYVYFNYGGTPGPHVSGAHRHSFGISKAAHLTVRRRAFRFIKRTGAAGLLQKGVSFFGAKNLSNPHAIESPALNTYLAGGSADAALPVDNSISSTAGGGQHTHNAVVGRAMRGDNPITSYQLAEASGTHSHSTYAGISSELRSMALALFESLGDAALPEGAIVGWDGGTPPAGWALCNGSNGTIDLTERFIYLTAVATAGVEYKSASVYSIFGSISGTSGSHRHTHVFQHKTEWTHTNAALNPFHDSMEGNHSHYVESVSGNPSGSLDNILRYQLRFIQYVGE